MYNTSFCIVTPYTTHVGHGMSRSPKRAVAQAKSSAWDKLCAWDGKHGACSSIGMEWLTMRHNGRTIFNGESYS